MINKESFLLDSRHKENYKLTIFLVWKLVTGVSKKPTERLRQLTSFMRAFFSRHQSAAVRSWHGAVAHPLSCWVGTDGRTLQGGSHGAGAASDPGRQGPVDQVSVPHQRDDSDEEWAVSDLAGSRSLLRPIDFIWLSEYRKMFPAD
jgi:hypothetical protein